MVYDERKAALLMQCLHICKKADRCASWVAWLEYWKQKYAISWQPFCACTIVQHHAETHGHDYTSYFLPVPFHGNTARLECFYDKYFMPTPLHGTTHKRTWFYDNYVLPMPLPGIADKLMWFCTIVVVFLSLENIMTVQWFLGFPTITCFIETASYNICPAAETTGFNGIAVTAAGRLPSSYIIHVDAQHYDNNWTEIVKRILIEADSLHIISVAVPALGTGTSCSAMLLCIMVDHELLNVDNHYDSLIKYAIYLSILAIPSWKIIVGIFYIH